MKALISIKHGSIMCDSQESHEEFISTLLSLVPSPIPTTLPTPTSTNTRPRSRTANTARSASLNGLLFPCQLALPGDTDSHSGFPSSPSTSPMSIPEPRPSSPDASSEFANESHTSHSRNQNSSDAESRHVARRMGLTLDHLSEIGTGHRSQVLGKTNSQIHNSRFETTKKKTETGYGQHGKSRSVKRKIRRRARKQLTTLLTHSPPAEATQECMPPASKEGRLYEQDKFKKPWTKPRTKPGTTPPRKIQWRKRKRP